MKTIQILILAVALSLMFAVSAFSNGHHEGDWSFGVLDGCAAVIEPEPNEVEPIILYPFIAGLFHGDWGVEFWNLPNPDLKSVRILFTSSPAGLTLFHESDLILGSDGFSTGPGYFDMSWPDPGVHHAHLDAYATAVGSYTVTFKLVNAVANDGYDTPLCDSPEYTLDFVAVPEPSSLLVLAAPAAALFFRRRS